MPLPYVGISVGTQGLITPIRNVGDCLPANIKEMLPWPLFFNQTL